MVYPRFWTDERDAVLTAKAGRVAPSAIAAALGVQIAHLRQRACALGLSLAPIGGGYWKNGRAARFAGADEEESENAALVSRAEAARAACAAHLDDLSNAPESRGGRRTYAAWDRPVEDRAFNGGAA